MIQELLKCNKKIIGFLIEVNDWILKLLGTQFY